MSILFEKIQEQFDKQMPFAAYCKPNSDKIIALVQKTDDLFGLDDLTSGFAFVSFNNEQRYLIPENQSDIYFETVSNLDFIFPEKREFTSDEKAKIKFENMVKKAVSEIENGTFEKVVLSRNEMVSISNFDLELIFNKLVSNYPTAFKYSFYHPKVGFWIGASPEQFLKIEKNKIQTIALAGTQLNTGLEVFNWQDKEIKEQQIVTDFIVDSLKKFSNNVSISEPYTFQAGALIHIKTDIQAEINDINELKKIINSLHPTPAVCGFPKESAKQFIMDNELYDREFYAGYLGEWNKDFLTFTEGKFDLFVNLRCMKIKNHLAELFIGCGINKGSIPEKEYFETVNKSQTMKKVL
jgi:isochorismate synthase